MGALRTPPGSRPSSSSRAGGSSRARRLVPQRGASTTRALGLKARSRAKATPRRGTDANAELTNPPTPRGGGRRHEEAYPAVSLSPRKAGYLAEAYLEGRLAEAMDQLRRELGESEERTAALFVQEQEEIRTTLAWIIEQQPEELRLGLENEQRARREADAAFGALVERVDALKEQVMATTIRMDDLESDGNEIEARSEDLRVALAEALEAQGEALGNRINNLYMNPDVARLREGIAGVEVRNAKLRAELSDALAARVKALGVQKPIVDREGGLSSAAVMRVEGQIAKIEARNEGFRVTLTAALEKQVNDHLEAWNTRQCTGLKDVNAKIATLRNTIMEQTNSLQVQVTELKIRVEEALMP